MKWKFIVSCEQQEDSFLRGRDELLEESVASEEEPKLQNNYKDDLESQVEAALAMPAPLLQMCRRLKLPWTLSVKKRLNLPQIIILLRSSLSQRRLAGTLLTGCLHT